MRWDHLFDDLEGQVERELAAEKEDLALDEERLRLGRLGVRDRIRALRRASPGPVAVTLITGTRLVLSVDAVGRDWVSADVRDGPVRRGPCLVPIAAIASIGIAQRCVAASLDPDAAAEASLALRLGLPIVLRDLCRRRQAVELVAAHATTRGTIDRVGLDHVDLAVHDLGSARRADQIAEVIVVPLASLLLVLF